MKTFWALWNEKAWWNRDGFISFVSTIICWCRTLIWVVIIYTSLIKPNLEHVHWTIKDRLFLSVCSVCSAYTAHKLTLWNLKIQTWIIKQFISSEFYYTPFQRGGFITFIDKSGVLSPLHIKCDQLTTVSWNSSKTKVSLCGVVMSFRTIQKQPLLSCVPDGLHPVCVQGSSFQKPHVSSLEN